MGASLVIQWLRLRAPKAGAQGSIPGRGTRSHTPQLMILHPIAKTQCSHFFFFLKKTCHKLEVFMMNVPYTEFPGGKVRKQGCLGEAII